MANFLLLYTGGGMPEGEAEQAKVMQSWMDWFTYLGEAVVDSGNPTSPEVKNIDGNGKITDGPVGAMVTGYSILKANNLEQAVKMAKGCPNIQSGGQVTVYETFDAM
jgi:hypothetical protein